MQSLLEKQTVAYLRRLEKQENKLCRQVRKRDSSLAKTIFGDIHGRYAALKKQLDAGGSHNLLYVPHLDSLSTSLSFIAAHRLTGVSSEADLQNALKSCQALQNKFDISEQIRQALLQRQELLGRELEKINLLKNLRQFQNSVYYYRAQITEIKADFENPEKIEMRLLQLAKSIPAFKSYFAKNSVLGSLFALPGADNVGPTPSNSLQTTAMLNQSLADRFGVGSNVTQLLQQNVQNGQSQLNSVRGRMNVLSGGTIGTTNEQQAPLFSPNAQKTKSFFKRLELGADVQSQRARFYFPVTSDIGLSAGYKLNDKSTLGIGASYKIGWGSGWNHIHISSEGFGLRSFIDYKVKGNCYISGGYERNYRTEFTSIEQLRTLSSWQTSGLIGLEKKLRLRGKLQGNIQLLWDFLSHRQMPRTQAVLFRIGYSLR